jgi:hypothetical protein
MRVLGAVIGALLALPLFGAIAVTGRVLDARGVPAPNVSVGAWTAAHGAENASGTTDEHGAFRFDSLASARYDFEANDDEGGRYGEALDVDVEQVHEVTIRLEKHATATIVGRVKGLEPAAIVRTVFANDNRGIWRAAVIEMSGEFRIENAPAGTVTLQVQAGASRAETRMSKPLTVDVAPGAEVRVELSFSPNVALHVDSVVLPASVTGTVVRIIDARDGRTLSGSVIARNASGKVVASANEPDPDGTVTLPLVPGAYQFSASASEYGAQTVRGEVPSGEVRILLLRGGKLLLHAAGGLQGTARLIQPNGEDYVRCSGSGIAEIRIDGLATVVDRIAPGVYTLEVAPTGGKPRRFPVTVVEGQTMTAEVD